MGEVDAVEMLGGRACVEGRLTSYVMDEDAGGETGANGEGSNEMDGTNGDNPAVVISDGVVAFRRPLVGACVRSVFG